VIPFPFRLWCVLCCRVAPVLVCGVLYGACFPVAPEWTTAWIYRPSLVGLVTLAILGGLFSIPLVCGKLGTRCPFCGRWGTVSGDKRRLWIWCDDCEIVTVHGLFLTFRRSSGDPDHDGDLTDDQ
jgi:hypothetical protein